MTLFATTRPGRWSVRFLGLFLLSFIVMQVLVLLGQQGGESVPESSYLAVTALVLVLSGLFACVAGAVGLIRHGERSVAVAISVLVGLLVTLFIAGEFFIPN